MEYRDECIEQINKLFKFVSNLPLILHQFFDLTVPTILDNNYNITQYNHLQDSYHCTYLFQCYLSQLFISDCSWNILLLLCKINRAIRHNLFRSEEERSSSDLPPCVSSFHHISVQLVRIEIWTFIQYYFSRDYQFFCSYNYVHLLRIICLSRS